MGSTFIKSKSSTSSGKGPFASSSASEVFLQFVPGVVTDVCTSGLSKIYINDRDVNSIIAKSHASENPNKGFAQDRKYIPLLRGIVDVPTIGDPVLLCTFAGLDYYLGPLNTLNNPNWNPDLLNTIQLPNNDPEVKSKTFKDSLQVSKNFKTTKHKRLMKLYNDDLDDPDKNQRAFRDISGDMLFEGRHGNSIRIGSRHKNPYLMISNGRNIVNRTESMNDGSLLCMFDSGKIADHFFSDGELDPQDGETILDKPFIIGSDTIKEGKRFVGNELYNYEYKESQVLLSSDKITINSSVNDIILSSCNNLVMGSGNSIKLFSNNETVIESSNIYLGKQARMKQEEGEKPEPLVLGIKLKEFMVELLEILESAHGLCQGAPIPVMDSTGAPLLPKWQGLIRKLKKPEFLSEYHYIEDNGQKAD